MSPIHFAVLLILSFKFKYTNGAPLSFGGFGQFTYSNISTQVIQGSGKLEFDKMEFGQLMALSATFIKQVAYMVLHKIIIIYGLNSK